MSAFVRLLSFSLLLSLFSSAADAQSWQWAQRAGGAAGSNAAATDIDQYGNSYITGTFQNSISFGTVTLNTPGLTSFFIAKYDLSGSLLWAKVGGSATSLFVSGICVDKSGTIAITGRFFGTATIGDTNPVSLVSTGDYDLFLASFAGTGEVSWAQAAGGPGIDYGIGVSTDNNGSLFITGDMHTGSFPGSSSKIFVARYDSTGYCNWFKTSKVYGVTHIANDIRTDGAGNSYVIGNFFNNLTFDSTIILESGNPEANTWIARFNGNGDVDWLQQAGAASGYMGGNSIDIDTAGNAYVTGFFKGTINLGSFSLAGAGNLYQFFMAKLDSNGGYAWAKKGDGQSNGVAISTDAAGNSYITGTFKDNFTLGPINLVNTGNSDLFVAKADPSGNFIWASQAGGKAAVGIGGIARFSNSLVVAGSYLDTLAFNSTLSLPGDNAVAKVFIARIDDQPTSVEDQHLTYGISIYPNPVKDEISLTGSKGNTEYWIYNTQGSLIMHERTKPGNRIAVTSLPAGTYFLQLSDGKATLSPARLKFIKL